MEQLCFEFIEEKKVHYSISFDKKTERELVKTMAEAIVLVIGAKENKSNGNTTYNEQD
jgi:hypothetical protein